MKRDFRDFLDDILKSVLNIQAFTAGQTLEDFRKDHRTSFAVIKCLEMIGEAVKLLPSDLKSTYPEIPWKRWAGMRDKLTHAYWEIDVSMVWDVVQSQLHALEKAVKAMAATNPKPDR